MANNYRVFHDYDGDISKPHKIDWTHEIGDVISKYSHENQYKCFEVSVDLDKTTYHFKQGKREVSYNYDWK